MGVPSCWRSRCLPCELAAAWSPPVSWTLVGGDSRLRAVRDEFAWIELVERAGTAEYLLGLPERVFRGAQQCAGDGGVQPGSRDQHVVEDQEEDQADSGGEQRLGQRVDVEAVAGVAVRAVREVAELCAMGRGAIVEGLARRPVPDGQRDPGEEH